MSRLPSSKPTARLVWAIVALVVILAGALATAHWSTARYVERTLEAFRSEVGPLDPDFYRPPRVAEADNAAVSYLAAAEALGLASDESELLKALVFGDSDWQEQDVHSVEALLESLGPVRELLSKADRLRSSNYGIDYSEVFTSGAGDLPSMLRLSKVLLFEARLASRRGDVEALLTSARSSAGLAASLRREGLVIYMLVATAAEKVFLQIVAEELERGATVEILEGFSRDLETLDRATLPLSTIFASEGAAGHQAMLVAHTARGGGNWSRPEWVFRGWLTERVNVGAIDVYRELVAASEAPFTELSTRLDAEGALKARTVNGKVRSMLVPNLLDGIGRYQATLSSRQLAVAAIEVRRLGLGAGAYPAASNLGASLEPSPYTGEMPDYERLEDGSVRLSYPEAADLWRERNSQLKLMGRTRLEWTLPPLS